MEPTVNLNDEGAPPAVVETKPSPAEHLKQIAHDWYSSLNSESKIGLTAELLPEEVGTNKAEEIAPQTHLDSRMSRGAISFGGEVMQEKVIEKMNEIPTIEAIKMFQHTVEPGDSLEKIIEGILNEKTE